MSDGLALEALEIRRGRERLLAIDRIVAPGEILTVMGPSGSGKSTLIACIGGFLDPAFTALGRIRLGGADVTALPAQARRIGIIFQDALLYPHMSVAGNILFALPRSLRGRAARRDAAEALLAGVGLEGFGARDPATLSGGQASRVALARTLAAEPLALLLDEPFSRLDAALRAEVRGVVVAGVRSRGIPAVLATHDRWDAEAAGGPVVTLGRGPR